MKLTTIFLLAATFQVTAKSTAQTITYSGKAVAVQKVFAAIEQQTRYVIFYDKKDLKDITPISVNFNATPLQVVLEEILRGHSLEYAIEGNTIVITKKISSNRKAVVEINDAVPLPPVTGIVKDSTGAPLRGAVIEVKGALKSTQTNAAGEFSIDVKPGDVLIISFVGFQKREIVIGSQSNIEVRMVPLIQVMDEVVVVTTALGIKREQRALGYAATTISNEDLTNSLSRNWTEALSGKVAGVNLQRTNGGPAGSNKIVIRGESSLAGTSEALIVVDGVVINSSSGKITGNGNGAYQGDDAAVDFGSSLNDINPEDIESVTVLKGPGATALYGARGAGGAIIITTKNGKSKSKGIGVSFNSNLAFESTSRFPDYQNEYGQGDGGQNYYSYGNTVDGVSTKGPSAAWGPRFNGQLFYQYDPETRTTGAERTPWVAYPENRSDFFTTGQTLTNSVSIEGGSGKTNSRLSYTNLHNTWIIPNTGYDRNTVALSVNQKVTDKFQISTKVNYINRSSDNLPATGYNNQTVMYWMMYQAPNVDLNWYKPYWIPGQEGIQQNHPFSGNLDNPYLIAYEMLNTQNRNSVIGNVQATYQFNDRLNLMVRTALDLSYDSRSQQRPKNAARYQDGMYRTQNIFSQETTSDFLLRYAQNISKFNFSVSAGGSAMKNRYIKDELRADRLLYPGIFNFSNSKDVPVAYPYRSKFAVNGLYAFITTSYDNFLYVDLSGRNDWSSTLATANSVANTSFFYPSVNASIIISQKLNLPKFISFLKLRASWAQVGNGGTIPYLTSYTYVSQATFPSGLSNPTAIANASLKAELSTNLELGTNIKFLKNRLSLDVAVYRNNTDKQIISTPIDRSTGYSSAVLNSGLVQNKGIEVEFRADVLKNKQGLNWTLAGTYYANSNTVKSLADSVETIVLQTGPGSRGSVEARVGGSMADFYGIGFQRSPEGQIIFNNGYPVLSQTASYLGKITPSWRGSVSNEFSYKFFTLSVLFDGQFGGKAYSLTNGIGMENGKLKQTLPGRYNGIIGNGVKQESDGKYVPNDLIAENIWTYYTQFGRDNVEANVFSTDYIKLREARVDFTLPARLTNKLHLQKVKFGIYGRDLLIISNWPAYDPEFATLGNGTITSGFEIGQLPATRTIGASLNINF